MKHHSPDRPPFSKRACAFAAFLDTDLIALLPFSFDECYNQKKSDILFPMEAAMNFNRPTVKPYLAERAKMLRKNMTPEERHLWYDCLKHCDCTFNRQYVIGNYIVDFFCHKTLLVIEIDGAQHYDEKGRTYDEQRTAYLKSLGLTVIRFTNGQIHNQFDDICRYIYSITSHRE